MTITIPDWIFCWPYWAGFGSATLIMLIVAWYVVVGSGPRF